MIALKKIREHAFLLAVALTYVALFILHPAVATASVKNSGYYLKEMLLIMPVIFVLTALLDLWLPKEKIVRFLGEDAGIKGLFLSFVVGSVSAGPIYAAFPMCVMLLKKGASLRNIIIILSSWAVIKVPMLLNEAKFLGPRFMIIRWMLTVLAILIFSWISTKILRDEDLPKVVLAEPRLRIDQTACMGCALCAKSYAQLFEMQGGKALIKSYEKQDLSREKLQDVIEACPVRAIDYSDP